MAGLGGMLGAGLRRHARGRLRYSGLVWGGWRGSGRPPDVPGQPPPGAALGSGRGASRLPERTLRSCPGNAGAAAPARRPGVPAGPRAVPTERAEVKPVARHPGPDHEVVGHGRELASATVVRTFRSAPREPGAAMAVSAEGEVIGSVSGGCVEGAVYELAREVCETGKPVLATYGVSDEDAFAVGLTCGGILHLLVEPVSSCRSSRAGEVSAAIAAGEPVAVASVIEGPGQVGAPEDLGRGAGQRHPRQRGAADAAVDDDARGMLAQGLTGVRRYGEHGERLGDELAVFVHSFAPPPRMLVFGAIDFAAAVARVGSFLGYRVTVCDAWGISRDARPLPRGRRGGRMAAASWPGRRRIPHGDLRADPRSQVRRAGPGGGAAHPGRVHRRHGQSPDASRTGSPGSAELHRGEDELARLRSWIGLTSGRERPRRPRCRSPRS